MSKHPKIYICFDYGEKRIGVAVGQSVTGTASSLGTIKTIQGKPDWNQIGKFLALWKPNRIVIGMPYNIDNTQHLLTKQVHRFKNQLKERYDLPISTMDERLSSFEATRLLSTAKKNKEVKASYQALDPIAAKLILQSWLAAELK